MTLIQTQAPNFLFPSLSPLLSTHLYINFPLTQVWIWIIDATDASALLYPTGIIYPSHRADARVLFDVL